MFDQIFQVCSHINPNDGVGNFIISLSRLLNENKINNKLFSFTMNKYVDLYKKNWAYVNTIKEYITPKTLIIYHYASHTSLSNFIPFIKCPNVLLYHNITPPIFFNKYNLNDIQFHLYNGYKDLLSMSQYYPYAWGVSNYNCLQLQEAGYKRTAVANPPCDFEHFLNIPPNKKICKNKNVKDILFVGRVFPHKCQEDIIKAFYYYHRINPNSELTLIGNYEGMQDYKNDLEKLSAELKIPVNITGMVSLNDLIAYYQKADLFLCMSEHEGFCIPLIEAMHFGVPVLAFASSAVPETISNAGIIFSQKHFPSVAHLMNEILNDSLLQEKMSTAGRQRAQYFSKENVSKRFIKLIKDYADELCV